MPAMTGSSAIRLRNSSDPQRPASRIARPPASTTRPNHVGLGVAAASFSRRSRAVNDQTSRGNVYRLSSNARVEDALQRAGGPTRRADLGQVNRAAKLEDGRQILVPVRPRASSATAGAGEVAPAASASGAGAPAESGTAAGSAPGQPLNLNTATLEQLDTLDGVGPATAQKILDYRTEHGGFGNVDELDQIPGIGEKRLAAMRERLRV